VPLPSRNTAIRIASQCRERVVQVYHGIVSEFRMQNEVESLLNPEHALSRRQFLKTLSAGSSAIGLAGIFGVLNAAAQDPSPPRSVPDFTGPSANPYWNSVGPIVT
jgi:hypothetical protein